MSKRLHYFTSSTCSVGVLLPFSLVELLDQWGQIRACMIRERTDMFSREEWAYLIKFLEPVHLRGIFAETFGQETGTPCRKLSYLYQPRGMISVWLPSNVSLLGPLTLILLSLTGNRLWLKRGTTSIDLMGAFLSFVRSKVQSGPLAHVLNEMLLLDMFDRDDSRNFEMAKAADVRIVFGSDQAAQAIHGMPHPVGSAGISFVDRRSEAWIEISAVSDSVLTNLLKVFAVYGQTGCTSPRRVILLGASQRDAVEISERLTDLWPRVIKQKPSIAVASSNIMSSQWARALGWQTNMTKWNASVLASGDVFLPEIYASRALMVCPATIAEALDTLAPNIQTIGYAFCDRDDPRWIDAFAATNVARVVPLAEMHHFGPVWDGMSYWRQMFRVVEWR